MRNLIKHSKTRNAFLGLAAIAMTCATVARAEGPADKGAAQAAAVQPDLEKLNQHLTKHQKYPATRAELLASCKDLVDFSTGEKRWFAARLPAGTYHSAAEVMKAIGAKL